MEGSVNQRATEEWVEVGLKQIMVYWRNFFGENGGPR